jgi:hypothetical protein
VVWYTVVVGDVGVRIKRVVTMYEQGTQSSVQTDGWLSDLA